MMFTLSQGFGPFLSLRCGSVPACPPGGCEYFAFGETHISPIPRVRHFAIDGDKGTAAPAL
jgi:hypothetical protein